MRPFGNKIVIEAISARLVVLLGAAYEAVGVSFVKFNFLKGLLLDRTCYVHLPVSILAEMQTKCKYFISSFLANLMPPKIPS